jgi:hypothetical protein
VCGTASLQVVTAALAGRWAMVEKLVQLGADVHAEDADTGATLLLMAARAQQWPLVRYLLDRTDADVDDVDRHGAPYYRTTQAAPHHHVHLSVREREAGPRVSPRPGTRARVQ